jgi:chaperone modulatory protein CbpM
VPTDESDTAVFSEARGFSMAELLELSGLSADDLQELIDYGALSPVQPEATPWVFSSQCLVTVRTASRLRRGFELEPHGLALAVSLLGRIRELETELNNLRARLPQNIR